MILTSLGRASFDRPQASRLAAQTTAHVPPSTALSHSHCGGVAVGLTAAFSGSRLACRRPTEPPHIVSCHDDLSVTKRRLVGRRSPGYGRVALVTSGNDPVWIRAVEVSTTYAHDFFPTRGMLRLSNFTLDER